MEIKQLKLKDLIPYANNPRKKQAIDKVASSIKEFGWQQPIVVDEEMVIVVGHTRYQAAQKLGLDKVPVQIATGLTEAQIKAYRLADNKLNENADWDNELLKIEIGALIDVGFDLSTLGFNEDELNEFFLDVNSENYSDNFKLDDSNKSPYQQITFTLADQQAEIIKEILSKVKSSEEFIKAKTFGNENSNGNLLFTLVTQSQWAK